VAPYRRVQRRVKWGDQKKVSRGRKPLLYNRRVAGLNKNQRQSRAEERILGRNMVHLLGNVQQKEGFGGRSYRGREEQII